MLSSTRTVFASADFALYLGWPFVTVSFACTIFGATERIRLSNDVAPGAIATRATNIAIDAFFVQFAMTF